MLALQIIYRTTLPLQTVIQNSIIYWALISLFVTLPGYWLAIKQYGAIGAAYIFCGVQTTITLIIFISLIRSSLIQKE